MKKLYILIIFSFVFFPHTTNVFSYSALVPVKNKNGMYQATFKLERGGEVNINLPSDMALDENVSGSVVYSGSLRQFELLIEGKLILMHGGGNFTYKLPGNVSTGVVNVVLRYSNGIEIGKAFFPVSIGKLRSLNNSTDKDAFDLPIFGNSGQPLMVKGPFDGNYTNTLITLSEKRLRILAESTTSCVFVTNNSISGPGILKLSELGENQETKFTNLAVVKVKERETQPARDFSHAQDELQEFAKKKVIEKDYEKIPDLSKIPPNELHQKEIENNVVSIPEEKEVSVRQNTSTKIKNTVKPKPLQNDVSASDEGPLDYSIIKSELDRQFESKFYPNKPFLVAELGDYQQEEVIHEGEFDDLTSAESDKPLQSNLQSESADVEIFEDKTPSIETQVKTPVESEKIIESEIIKDSPKIKEKAVIESNNDTNLNQEKGLNAGPSIESTLDSKKEEEILEEVPEKINTSKETSELKTDKSNESGVENNTDQIQKNIKTEDEMPALTEKPEVEKKAKKSEIKAPIDEKKVKETISRKKAESGSVATDKKPDSVQANKETSKEVLDIIDVINPGTVPGNNEIASILDTASEKDKVEQPNDIDTDSEQSNKTDKIKEYCIQLASFKTQSEVDEFVKIVKFHGYSNDVKRVNIDGKGTWHRVRICDFNSRNEAESYKKKINQKKLNVSSIYITEY